MHLAFANGFGEAATLLLKHSNVSLKNEHGQLALHIAATNNTPHMLPVTKALVTQTILDHEWTVLHSRVSIPLITQGRS